MKLSALVLFLYKIQMYAGLKDKKMVRGNRKERKKHRCFIWIGLFLMMATIGCSGIQVSQDYQPNVDFSGLKSYAWKYDDQEKTGDIRVDSPLLDARIRQAVEKKLSEKNFVKTLEKTPDFYVRYTYDITKKITSRPVHTHLGYGHYRHRHGTTGLLTGGQIDEFNEGLLVIDFLKPGTDDLLWRAVSTRLVENHTTPEKSIRDIDETIGKMLAQFPP